MSLCKNGINTRRIGNRELRNSQQQMTPFWRHGGWGWGGPFGLTMDPPLNISLLFDGYITEKK